MKGYRIPHHKLMYVMPSCHLHGQNSSRLISSSTSHQTHECIMSSSTRYVISNMALRPSSSAWASARVHHHHRQRIKHSSSQCMSSPSSDQGKVISKLHHHQTRHHQGISEDIRQYQSISIIWAPPHQIVTTVRVTIKKATHNCCCHQYNHQVGWHQ